MALHYANIALEHREIVLKDKPQAMLDASPKGTVPVLVFTDTVIDESIDVIRWALTQSDPDQWLVHDVDHKLIQNNDGEFKHYLDRYKYFDRYPEYPQRLYQQRCMTFLQELESSMIQADEQFFLLTPSISVLDIAIFPFVRQFAFVDKVAFDALQLPKVQAWLRYFLEAPLFLSIMEKRSVWQP